MSEDKVMSESVDLDQLRQHVEVRHDQPVTIQVSKCGKFVTQCTIGDHTFGDEREYGSAGKLHPITMERFAAYVERMKEKLEGENGDE